MIQWYDFFQSLKEEIVVNNDKKLIKRLLNELEVSLNTTLALFLKILYVS